MAERSVAVRLSANVDAFVRAFDEAAASADKLEEKLKKNATEQSKIAASQSQAWADVSTSMVKAGAAGTAFVGILAKSGIEYNVLQQRSRAALTTILQGSEAANAQMDKLDAFARTSPFAKQVFIEAQQQMLGFGIEAQKVIPYLSAIQDTTAAVGGNNNDIAELSRIFSQVSSSAKITAQDLMQFGTRGVDAATLIGSQMGKTAGQIREEITAGTLDAGDALDALAAGMTERFGGAAENVKDTMVGAFDSLAAAWRDLSASIMSSAVDPDGGGWLVDLTNRLADLLRAVEAIPTPITQAATGIAAVGSAGLLAVGGTMKMATEAYKLHESFKQLAKDAPNVHRAITTAGRVAGVAAIALGTLSVLGSVQQDMDGVRMAADELAAKLNLVKMGAEDLDTVFEGMGPLLKRLTGETEGLDDVMGLLSNKPDWLADSFSRLMAGLTGLQTPLLQAEERMRAVGEELTSLNVSDAQMIFREIAESSAAMDVPLEYLLDLMGSYTTHIRTLAAEAGVLNLSQAELAALMAGKLVRGLQVSEDGTRLLTQAQIDAGEAMEETASHADRLADAHEAAAEAAQAHQDATRQVATAALDASAAEMKLIEAVEAATASVKENGETLNLNTVEGRANQSALDDVAAAALRNRDAMIENGAGAAEVNRKTREARAEFVRVAEQMGLTSVEAQQLATEYGLIPTRVHTQITADFTDALRKAQEIQSRINNMRATMTVDVRQNVTRRLMGQVPVWTGGMVGDVAEAYGLAGGGRTVDAVTRSGFSGKVTGPGTTTSDEALLTALSREEFVLRAWAAQKIGYDNLYYMNATGSVPEQMRDGGRPSAERWRSAPSMPSAPSVSSVTATLDPATVTDATRAGMIQALRQARFQIDGRDIQVHLGLDHFEVRMHAQGRG